MRVCVIVAGLMLLCAHAMAEPKSFADAWSYVSTKGKPERWIVVYSPKKNGYFQCENLDDAVRCSVPAWNQVPPNATKKVLPVGGREKPYPEMPGTKRHVFIKESLVEKSKQLFVKFGLDPFLVYSRVKDENLKIIGTQCDLRVMLSFKFINFEALAKEYLREMFGVTDADGYAFDSDR